MPISFKEINRKWACVPLRYCIANQLVSSDKISKNIHYLVLNIFNYYLLSYLEMLCLTSAVQEVDRLPQQHHRDTNNGNCQETHLNFVLKGNNKETIILYLYIRMSFKCYRVVNKICIYELDNRVNATNLGSTSRFIIGQYSGTFKVHCRML